MKLPSMEEELNSSLVIFELMGLQYFSLKQLSKENQNDRPTVVRTIYMVVLLVLVSTLMLVFIWTNNNMAQEHITAKNVLMFMVQNSMNVGLFLVVCTSLIQSFMSTRLVMKIYFNIKDMLHLYLQEFGDVVDFKKVRRASLKRVFTMLTFFFITHGSTTFISMKSYDDVVIMLIGAIPLFFLLMVVFKFIFYVEMVNSQLKFLNEILMKVWTCQSTKFIDNIYFQVTKVKSVKTFEDPLRKLRVLRRIYNIIHENGNLINDSNGLTILTMLVCLVAALTASGYEAFVIGVGGMSSDKLPETIYVIVVSLTILVAAIFCCQRTCLIVSLTKLRINFISNYSFYSDDGDCYKPK